MLSVTILSIMLNVIMLSVTYSECPNHMQYNDAQHNNKNCNTERNVIRHVY
jgi:hypothetical protein